MKLPGMAVGKHVLALAAVLTCAQGYAAAPSAADETVLPTVTVGALRDPVDKSYRKMISGMDLFERMHSLAPQATLRYKLLPRQPGTNMNGISVNILSENVSIPVRVAADHTFTLERNQKA